MSGELERLRRYVAALPPPRSEVVEAARTDLELAMHRDRNQERRAGPTREPWRSRGARPRGVRPTMVLGIAFVLLVGVFVGVFVQGHGSSPHRRVRSAHRPPALMRLVADDVNVTVASGSYDMTFDDTTTPSPRCAPDAGGSGSPLPGLSTENTCSNLLPSISGHGTVDTNPYAMVAVSQDGPLGVITLYDNGTDVWEIGGGDYGLAGPGRAAPGAPLSGYAGSVEGTVGQQAGALDMQGLASGTGYLDLEAEEIQGAEPAGTGTVDGVPVTVYKVSVSGLQDPDLSGLTAEQVKTIQAADAILEETGFPGKTTLVSVDADGYIRETRTTYTLSNGSTVVQDTVLSNFGCAGTVLMPGQTGSTAPPVGCISPDTAGGAGAPATETPATPTTSTTSTTSTTPTTHPTAPAAPTPTTSQTSTGVPPSSRTGTPVFLLGDGIGSVRFGDTEASAIAGLAAALGSGPVGSTSGQIGCNIDLVQQWPNITAYFSQGTFVGYSTLAANGEVVPAGNLVTARGLRIGDTLAAAQQLYGAALSTSFAQGGSWAAATPEGKLEGFLSDEPDQIPPPTILSIAAGDVGCPAATP